MALPVITNNAPSAGYISWTAFSIQYGGVGYSVGAGSSNKKFVWWEYNGGTPILQTSDTLPDLAVEDYLLFLNKSGIGLIVDTTQVIDGSLIVSGSILADGIGANQIQSWHVNANAITAGKIAAGTITSNEIAAGAISAEKLSIGAVGDNMVLNGSFEDGTQGFTVVSAGAGAVADVVTGVSSSGANALRLVRGTAANLTVGQTEAAYIPVTSVAGRSWYVACRAGAGSALASGFYLRVFWLQADKVTAASTASVDVAANVALTTAWSVFEGAVTPPANARYMRIAVINALSGSTMYVDEITAHEVIMSAQIGSGQITAAKIASNTITANQIAANAVTAVKIAANAVTATQIAANAITADKIEATAIDGKTITGPTIRTAASGQRVQLDTAGLRTFDASNVETAKLAADAGGLNLTGSLVTTAGGNTRRATLSDGGLYLDLPGSPGADNLTVGPGYIRSTDANSRLIIEKQSGSPGTGVSVQAGNSPGSSAALDVNGDVPGGEIKLGAAAVWAGGLMLGGTALRGGETDMNALSVAGKAHIGLRFWRTDLDMEFMYWGSGLWLPSGGKVPIISLYSDSNIGVGTTTAPPAVAPTLGYSHGGLTYSPQWRVTVPYSGLYRITAMARTGTEAAAAIFMFLYKNGSVALSSMSVGVDPTHRGNGTISDLIPLSAGDYIGPQFHATAARTITPRTVFNVEWFGPEL